MGEWDRGGLSSAGGQSVGWGVLTGCLLQTLASLYIRYDNPSRKGRLGVGKNTIRDWVGMFVADVTRWEWFMF